MDPLRLTALAAALLAAGCGGGAGGPAAPVEAEGGVVARVVDGDTIRLRDGRRVRLVQVDAPERSECHADAAAAALASLAPPGRRVVLVRDPRLDAADEGGRLLRYVEAGDVEVNVRLVELGAAVPYFFRGARGRLAGRLLAAARAARAQRRGLWGACPRARLEPRLGSLTGPA